MNGRLLSNATLWKALLVLWLASAAGCRSPRSLHQAAISGFDAGDPATAKQQLVSAREYRRAEAEILDLDRAVVSLMDGSADEAERLLRDTRKQLDYLAQKDVTEQTVAILTDDQAVAWSGREYERRMLDCLLVLANLAADGHDAYAYSMQARQLAVADYDELAGDHSDTPSGSQPSPIVTVAATETAGVATAKTELVAPPRLAPNALATYLYAAMQSETPSYADSTDRAIRQISFWQSDFITSAAVPAVRPAAASSSLDAFGTQTEPGHGVLHVVTLVGRITPWDEEYAHPTSAALLVADRILSATGKHSLPPTVAPVKLAKPRSRCSTQPRTTLLTVESTGGESSLSSRVLVDLNQAAWDSYEADRDRRLGRAIARRVVKKAAVYAAKDQLAVGRNTGLDLALNLGGIAWEALEKADTRHWTLLPERIEVVQAELSAGRHQIQLALSGGGLASRGSATVSLPVIVDDGRNTFLICFRPSGQGFAGEVLGGGTQNYSVTP